MSTLNLPAHRQLAAWLKEHGHTHVWLAQAIGVSYSAVTSWLNGATNPQSRYGVAINRITGIQMPVARVGRPGNAAVVATTVPLAQPEAQEVLAAHIHKLAVLPEAISQLTSTNRDLIAVLDLLVQFLASAEHDARQKGSSQ